MRELSRGEIFLNQADKNPYLWRVQRLSLTFSYPKTNVHHTLPYPCGESRISGYSADRFFSYRKHFRWMAPRMIKPFEVSARKYLIILICSPRRLLYNHLRMKWNSIFEFSGGNCCGSEITIIHSHAIVTRNSVNQSLEIWAYDIQSNKSEIMPDA